MSQAESKIPEKLKLVVSTSPHIKGKEDISRIMWTVSALLMPAALAGVVFYGSLALYTILLCVGSAVATEAIIQKLMKKKVTVSDGSAFLTGLLLAMVISPMVIAKDVKLFAHLTESVGMNIALADILSRHLYIPILGGFFAIALAKHIFGGLGCNIWNPALLSRAFLLIAFASFMTAAWPDMYPDPLIDAEAVTSATPRKEVKGLIKQSRDGQLAETKGLTDPREAQNKIFEKYQQDGKARASYVDLLIGKRGGSLGESCSILLLLGGLVLVFLRYIDWRVPLTFIGSAVLLGWALPFKNLPGDASLLWFGGDPLFELLSGGLIIGAFFMATDMVTSPITKKGAVIFGLGCGVITVAFRKYGGYPEGVCYAILLMNTAVPLIDRYTRPRVFGTAKSK